MMVSDRGTVLAIETGDWDLAESLVVLKNDGAILARYQLEDFVQYLGVTEKALKERADSDWYTPKSPSYDPINNIGVIDVAGYSVQINLSTGKLQD